MHEYAEIFLRWLPTAESGRTTPAFVRADGSTMYRPHFRVGPTGEFLGVAFLDGDPPLAAPGSEGSALVEFIYVSTGVDYTPLQPGVSFDVLEGLRVIARGTVRRRWQSDADWRSQRLRQNQRAPDEREC